MRFVLAVVVLAPERAGRHRGRRHRGTDLRRPREQLPTPRHGLGVIAVGSTLYVMSGGPTPGTGRTRCAKRSTFA